MFTDQRNELLRSYEKCNRVNKPEQAKNDEAGQPIRISAREKFSEKIAVIHPGLVREENVQRSMPNAQSIRRPKSETRNEKYAKRRIEFPTNPESFRGCSISANDK
jgi:hypothetical protein